MSHKENKRPAGSLKKRFADAFTKEGAKKNGLAFYHSLLWVAIIMLFVDLISKWAVQSQLETGTSVTIIPGYLFVTLHHNLGAAWGFGGDGPPGLRILWIFISLSMSVVLLVYHLLHYRKMKTAQKTGLVLMISGAVGNLIDRLFYWNALVGFNGVIDWIDFHTKAWKFPYFNVADACLVIGVVILIIIMLIDTIKDTIAKDKAAKRILKAKKGTDAGSMKDVSLPKEDLKKETKETKVRQKTEQDESLTTDHRH